jgi:NAD(P)-dependent dehydrogenase (short-subunit alcohol dehydrogenase family)
LNIVDTEQSRSAAEEVGRQHSTIDILVNNAGVFKGKAFSALVPEDFDWIMTATFKGVFHRAICPAPPAQWGRVVTISSTMVDTIPGKGNTSMWPAGRPYRNLPEA